MTPTTAPSSSVLLTSVVQNSNSTATTAVVEAAPDAALSGFQLLLGAMQQQFPTNTSGASDSETPPENAEETSGDSGNVLPLLGMILPQTAPDETVKVDGTGAAKSKNKKDQDADTSASVTNVMSPVTVIPLAGFIIQPHGDNASTTATATVAPTDAALAVQSDTKDFATGRANSMAIASMAKGKTNAMDTTIAAETSPAAIGKEVQAAATNLAESDFDTLVKHFDAPNQTSLPAINIGDSAGTNHASRTYLSAASTATAVAVQVPVGSDGWSDAVADKVMWFSANKISSAEIHLNPPDLGPLQVRVSTQHDQTNVVFTSQHAAVRDALDQALPRLRDMMGSQGMHSLDVSVGGQNAQQQQQQFDRNDSTNRGVPPGGFFTDDIADGSAVNVTTVNTVRLLRSGVDAYA